LNLTWDVSHSLARAPVALVGEDASAMRQPVARRPSRVAMATTPGKLPTLRPWQGQGWAWTSIRCRLALRPQGPEPKPPSSATRQLVDRRPSRPAMPTTLGKLPTLKQWQGQGRARTSIRCRLCPDPHLLRRQPWSQSPPSFHIRQRHSTAALWKLRLQKCWTWHVPHRSARAPVPVV